MKYKTVITIALCAITLSACAKDIHEPTESVNQPSISAPTAVSSQEQDHETVSTVPSLPDVPVTETVPVESTMEIPMESTSPSVTMPEVTVTEPVEETVPQYTEPEVTDAVPESTVPETTVPIEDDPCEPLETEPTVPTEPETEPEKQPVPEAMLRDLEAFGRSYAVSTYGYEVDTSMGFSNSGYYPGLWGWFTADDYGLLQSLVMDAVDVTTENLIARSGPIWGYREDNGKEWHTRINIIMVDDGDGMYTCWVFYG